MDQFDSKPAITGGIKAYRLAGNLRFFGSVLVAIVLLLVWIGLVSFINYRIAGGIGLFLALTGGSSLLLGLLLVYWNIVDWSNLGIIRASLDTDPANWENGEVIALEGIVTSDQPPITSPFSHTRCAAYSYEVSGTRHRSNRGSSIVKLAAGQHLLPTWIEGEQHKLRLYAFPGLEDDLRESFQGRDYKDQLAALFKHLEDAPNPPERDRTAAMIQAREGWAEELHRNFRMGGYGNNPENLTLSEEVLPMGETVCVTGTYDAAQNGISARRGRIGRNLMVYRGNATEVLERVGKENRRFFKIAGYLTGFGVLVSVLAAWSPSWLSVLG